MTLILFFFMMIIKLIQPANFGFCLNPKHPLIFSMIFLSYKGWEIDSINKIIQRENG